MHQECALSVSKQSYDVAIRCEAKCVRRDVAIRCKALAACQHSAVRMVWPSDARL